MNKEKLVNSGVHNIKWIIGTTGEIFGALHGTTFMNLDDIKETPHVRRLYNKYNRTKAKESKNGQSNRSNKKRSKLRHK